MSLGDQRYMVDGVLRDQRELREIFRPGENEVRRLSVRQRVAAEMVGRVCRCGRLLDVGCYAGTFLEAVARAYPDIDWSGVDAYPDNVRIARELYPRQAERFREQTAYALGFSDETFDCVLFLEVLEHVDRPVDAVRELNRVTRTGGHLVLSTPNGVSRTHIAHTLVRGYKNALLSLLRKPHRMATHVFYESVDWNRHLIEFSLMSLHTLLSLNGFELLEHRFIPTGMHRSVLDVLVPGFAKGQILLLRKTRAAPRELI